jgi:hypothetical protein
MKTAQLRSTVIVLAFSCASACGGAPPPEAPRPEPSAAPEPPVAEKTPKPEPGTDGPSAPVEPEPSAEPKPELKGRNITYRMTPGGLVIDVEGVEFVPKAEAVKSAAGGHDVALSVKATSKDGNMHRLLSPENGPLMVFSRIERGEKATDNPDERKGDGEEFISPGDSITLERKIPAKLTAGSTITLQVGLWGLGLDAAERKPIKKLFWLKMAGSNKKPTPVITAPE